MTLKETNEKIGKLAPIVDSSLKGAIATAVCANIALTRLEAIVNDMETHRYIDDEAQPRVGVDKEDLINNIHRLIKTIEADEESD